MISHQVFALRTYIVNLMKTIQLQCLQLPLLEAQPGQLERRPPLGEVHEKEELTERTLLTPRERAWEDRSDSLIERGLHIMEVPK